jgi:hypothetical protein
MLHENDCKYTYFTYSLQGDKGVRRTQVNSLISLLIYYYIGRAGVPRSVATKLTGHKTEAIYRRYAIVSEADLSEGVAKLSALHQRENGAERVVVPMSERKGKAGAVTG